MPKSRRISLYLASFLFGVLIAVLLNPDFKYFLVLFTAVFVFWIFLDLYPKGKDWNKIYSIFAVGMIFFTLGIARGALSFPDSYTTSSLNNTIKNIEGEVVGRPYIKNSVSRIVLDVDGLQGKVLIFDREKRILERGDRVEVKCFFREPEKIGRFNYPAYLAKDQIYSLCFSPEVLRIKSKNPSLLGWFDNLSKEWAGLFDTYFLSSSGFYKAIVLGDRSGLDRSIQDIFSQAGISHIIAISGMHLVILSGGVFFILRGIGFSKKYALVAVLVFFMFFLFVIGFKVSALRASLFAMITALSFILKRKIYKLNLLLFTASLLVFISPQILAYDIGFQLSFLAVAGIFYFYKFFNKIFNFVPYEVVKNILTLTFSAQMFTLPWIIYRFESFPLGFPLSNLLTLLVVPWALGVGVVFVISSFLPFSFLSYFLGWIGDVLYRYIYLVAKSIADIKFLFFKIEISIYTVMLIYAVYFLLHPYVLEKIKIYFNKVKNQSSKTEEYEMDISRFLD